MAHYRFGDGALDLDRVVGFKPIPAARDSADDREAPARPGARFLVVFDGADVAEFDGPEGAAIAEYIRRLPDASVAFEPGVSGEDHGPVPGQGRGVEPGRVLPRDEQPDLDEA